MDFLEELIATHGKDRSGPTQSGLRCCQNREAGKCLLREKITFSPTLSEGEVKINPVDTESNAPTNSSCNVARKNEEAYLLHWYWSCARAKISQVTSNNMFSSRLLRSTKR